MAATETTSHRLVLPADANHHGTLYAGSLLRYALESGYATACRAAGPEGNLMLRRVLSLECRRSVPVGSLVEMLATGPLWQPLIARLEKLAAIRGATADWIAAFEGA